jgi:hypothetical protein
MEELNPGDIVYVVPPKGKRLVDIGITVDISDIPHVVDSEILSNRYIIKNFEDSTVTWIVPVSWLVKEDVYNLYPKNFPNFSFFKNIY